MEVSPRKFAENWQVPTIGTMLQMLITSLIVSIIGVALGWSIAKILLLERLLA